MLIRPFVPDDAPALAALFHAAVRGAGPRHHTAAQIVAWSPRPPDPNGYPRRAATATMLVAVGADGAPLGYGDVDADGYIDHLYCWPDRMGTGSALLAALEAAARATDARALTVAASEGLRPLLERRGFRVVRSNDVALAGVVLRNYAMMKPLG